MSHLANEITLLGEVLKSRAMAQVKEHLMQTENMDKIYHEHLKHVIIQDWDIELAKKTALELFGREKLRYAAIDGTERTEPTFEIMIFYGGAYAALGTVDFTVNGRNGVEIDAKLTDKSTGLAACIPIYASEIPEIMINAKLSFVENKNEDSEIGDEGNDIYDESVIDNSQIASDIMLLSELRLALELARKNEFDVILLDRYLAGTHSTLLSKTVNFGNYSKKSHLIGFKTKYGKITKNDLWLNRYRPFNRKIGIPPPRGEYLIHRIFFELESSDKETVSNLELIKLLGLESNSKVISRINKALRTLDELKVVEILSDFDSNLIVSIKKQYKNSYKKIKDATEQIISNIFDLKDSSKNPLRVIVNKKEKWLTSLDIALLSLYTLNELIEIAQKRPMLLIGITKDTYSRDFRNQFLNFLTENPESPVKFSKIEKAVLPQTDRGLLQTMAHQVINDLHPPWATQEYDTAFRTMGPKRDEKWPVMSGSYQNIILSERMFLKSFIQLREGKTMPELRSTVLMIDRVVLEKDIKNSIPLPDLIHNYGGAREYVKALVMPADSRKNEIQNLVMNLLIKLDAPSIPEAMGHNKPLFIADKICKWFGEVFGSIVSTTKQWMETNKSIRSFGLHISSFREKRTIIESTRRGNSQ